MDRIDGWLCTRSAPRGRPLDRTPPIGRLTVTHPCWESGYVGKHVIADFTRSVTYVGSASVATT